MTLESNFPRGGKKTPQERSRLKSTTEDEDLFKVIKSERKPSKSSKGSKKKRKLEKAGLDDSEETVVIDNLSSKTLLTDMLIMGCLREVGDYGLNVSLPGGLSGKVPVTNISDRYTELLRRYSEDPQSLQEEMSTLSSMFKAGTCLPMRVISHTADTASSKSATTLSIKPADVNRDIIPSSVFNGMLLLCSVKSVEDHGYVMDVGIGNLQGFLSSSESRPLCVGQTTLCSVNMPNLDGSSAPRVLTLSVKHKALNTILDLDENHVNLNSLLPGTQIKSMVMETKRNGLVVKCSQYSGCVYRDHLKNIFDTTVKYEMGKLYTGLLLYIHPVSNQLHLSFADKLTPKSFKSAFPKVKYGDIIQDAKVLNVTNTRVYFHINEKVKGLAKLNNLGDNFENIDNPADVFNVGDVHRCRIIGFNYMDKLAVISLKSATFKQVLLDKGVIQVGEVFTGIIDQHVKQSVKVRLGQGSFGLVPYLHLADHEISNPIRQFPPGMKVKCRVLRVDQVGNYVSPLLTCKRTLVHSKLEPLKSYAEAEVKALHHGVVVQANSSGLLLTFYNDVKGWVPIQELSTEYIQYPEKMFYIGQVVKAAVLRCKPEESKLYLSLKLETNKPFGQKEMTAGKTMKAGDLVSAKVTGKSAQGLDVMIGPDEVNGFLPVNHLSDHPRLCKLYLELYDINDIISPALCFSTKGTIIISKKRMLCEAATSGNLVHSWQNLHPGQLVPGVVKSFLNYGIIVELGRSIAGLANMKHLVDSRVNDPRTVGFTTHQSVVTRVLDVNPDARKVSLSTKLSDVCEKSSIHTDSVQWLHNFLSDWEDLCSLHVHKGIFSELAAMKIGSTVQVRIKSISAEGILCETDTGIAGIITKNNIGECKPELHMATEAVVLHVDLRNNCAELSICPSLVRDCKLMKKQGKSNLKQLLGETFPSTVLLIRTHFVLAALHKPASGVLTYVPVYRHPNDLVGFSYKTGDNIQLTVQKVCKQFVICSKTTGEMGATKRKNPTESNKSTVKSKRKKQDLPVPSFEMESAESTLSENLEGSSSEDFQRTGQTKPTEVNRMDKLDAEEHGSITNCNKRLFFVKLRSGATGTFPKQSVACDTLEQLTVGAEVKVMVVGRRKDYLKLRLRGVAEKVSHVEQIPVNINTVKFKPCLRNSDNDSSDESDDEKQETVAKIGLSKFLVPITSGTDENTTDRLEVPGGFSWDVDSTPNLNLMGQNQLADPDSSDNEDELDPKRTSSKAKNKQNKLKQEEEFLTKQEQRLMDLGREPETVDDFDRLVLSQPDNSVVWLKYMSFHLQQAEVDKARAVAQKALNTISFREEQEKLNIWFALLNLENLYGTNETLEVTFQKAVQFNEPFKVYMHLAKVYTESEKKEEAETLYTVMIRKFKGQPETWLSYALHCLKTGKTMKASDLFQQCLARLDKRHHVEVVSKFAHMEFKHGESERGKTMMESLLASYPKRTDLWSQYSDLLLKKGDTQGTRQVLERAVSLNLPARKMKFLFKKYLDFEKQHGSEELVEKVKQKAREYVQSKPEDSIK